MDRVRSVLKPAVTAGVSTDQEASLAWLSNSLDRFGTGRKNSVIASTMMHAGNYWRCGILLVLRSGPYRPVTIARLLCALDPGHQISRRILNMNLRELERDGLIKRYVLEDGWNHVEYALTEEGQSFVEQVQRMLDWVQAHAPRILEARAAFDAQKDAY
jgi:DNA-binding HxlR family transcriptional regulator